MVESYRYGIRINVGANVNIRVIVNYPQTEEGIKELNQRQAKAILSVLKDMMSPQDLDTLIKRLSEKLYTENIS
jgi:hypothetical protein